MSDIHPDISIGNDNTEPPRDDEPMTPEQSTQLLHLSQRAEEPAYDENLSRFEAENRIALLRRKLER